MLSSKRGAAILQVLLVAAILAGIATMLLRANLARTTSAQRIFRTTYAQNKIESCMGEINWIWANKPPEIFMRDLNQGIIYCKTSKVNNEKADYECKESERVTSFSCIMDDDGNGSVTATVVRDNPTGPITGITYKVNAGGTI